MRGLGKSFATGLLVVLPVVLTFALLALAFTKLNALVFSRMGALIPGLEESPWLTAGLGIVMSVGSLVLIGAMASHYLGARLVEFVDRRLAKLPLVKLIYGSIKDLLGAFVGDRKSFDVPVLVGIGDGGAVKVLGFITREGLDFLGLSDHVAVYLPQSYNFAGNVLVVAKDRVQVVEADSSEVMAFLVSGGVSGFKSSA